MLRKLAYAVVLAAVLAVAGVSWWQHDDAQRRDTAARQSTAAATAAAQAICSYDYRSFDTSVAHGRSFATGDFAQEYGQTTGALTANAVKAQAIVRASVSASGVVCADRARVELRLYLKQC